MTIVATEIESIHGATTGRHLVFYRCQDQLGAWHSYGPIRVDAAFDAEAFKPVVASKMAAALAQNEFEGILR